MKSIIANASESRLIREGKQTIIVSLVKPQPFIDDKGHICQPDRKGSVWNFGKTIYDKPAIENFTNVRAPYKIGSPVYLREPFREVYLGKRSWFMYEADKAHDDEMKYYSPATMPKDAARAWVDPVRNECKRVRDVTRQDLIARFGFQGHNHSYITDWIQYIINKFGQPAWDSNAWVFLTHVQVNKELSK